MRIANWPTAMFEAIEQRRSTPFEWGTHDCCLFAADVVLAMTGVDYAAEFRGQYDSAETAQVALQELGAGDLISTVDTMFKRVPLLQAQRGDVVATQAEYGMALGICAGGGCLFAGPEGLSQRPLQLCVTAWRVV